MRKIDLLNSVFEWADSKKIQNPIQRVFDWVEDRQNNETLDFTSVNTLKRGVSILSSSINKLLNKQTNRLGRYLSSKLTSDYYKYVKQDFQKQNKGLKGYRLNDVRKSLRGELQQRIEFSLSLITTQNKTNMDKLKTRFMDWVNIQTLGIEGDKTKLKDALKLEEINKKNKKHAKFVVKDQTMKMIGNFDEIIAKHYDAIAFVWHNRRDKRVVGNPAGIYPEAKKESKMHGNHWIREGKVYFYPNSWAIQKKLINKNKVELTTSLKDGLPGKPIGCRCYAQNLYALEDISDEFLTELGKNTKNNI